MTPLFIATMGPVQWPVSGPALGLVLLLLVVFAYSTQRALRRLRGAPAVHRHGVLLLNALAWIAVVLLVAPPAFERASLTKVALLTEGTAALPASKHRYRFGQFDIEGTSSLQSLGSVGQLPLKHPGLKSLTLTGHGLDTGDWRVLPDYLEILWQPPAISGLVDLRWTSRTVLGQQLELSGSLRWENTNQQLTIELIDPAGVTVDSTEARDRDGFVFTALPQVQGSVSYVLRLSLDNAVISEEQITVYISKPPSARLLVLQSAPSFETRQVSNWAADEGATLLVKTTISRDRDLIQRINLNDTEPVRVDETLLQDTDLVLIDGRHWIQLPPTTQQNLLSAVEQGLGLMLWIDDSFAEASLAAKSETPWGVQLRRERNDEPRWVQSSAALESAPLPVAPWALTLLDARPLTLDETGEVLESWRPLGRGRIALSRLRSRHRWATLGEQSVFSRDWARVLATLGRVANAPRWLPLTLSADVQTGQRTLVCTSAPDNTSLFVGFTATADGTIASPTEAHQYRTQKSAGTDSNQRSEKGIERDSGQSSEQGSKQGSKQGSEQGSGHDAQPRHQPGQAPLRLIPDPLGSPRACGYIWPSVPGWHELALLDAAGNVQDTTRLFVASRDAFNAHRFARRQQATVNYIAGAATVNAKPVEYTPLSPWWSWGLLLMSLVPLWLERRLFDLQ